MGVALTEIEVWNADQSRVECSDDPSEIDTCGLAVSSLQLDDQGLARNPEAVEKVGQLVPVLPLPASFDALANLLAGYEMGVPLPRRQPSNSVPPSRWLCRLPRRDGLDWSC